MRSLPTPQEIIETLGMSRHPEGGWYAESFRDSPSDGSRGHSTAIYYLLQRGERSHWHRVLDADEVWHWYAGGPLRLRVSHEGRTERVHLLGQDLAHGQRPQYVVPAGSWQAAEPVLDWVLVGCTVAPAFSFDAFEMAPKGWSPGA